MSGLVGVERGYYDSLCHVNTSEVWNDPAMDCGQAAGWHLRLAVGVGSAEDGVAAGAPCLQACEAHLGSALRAGGADGIDAWHQFGSLWARRMCFLERCGMVDRSVQ